MITQVDSEVENSVESTNVITQMIVPQLLLQVKMHTFNLTPPPPPHSSLRGLL